MLQETSFGAVLDVSTDILSRGLLWAWALDGPLAALPILLECFTFTSTYSVCDKPILSMGNGNQRLRLCVLLTVILLWSFQGCTAD